LQCNIRVNAKVFKMKAQLIAAGFAMLAFGAVAPAAMADGPRAASGNNWAGMSAPVMAPQAASVPSPATEGPRASSGNNWLVAPGQQIAAVPQDAAAAPVAAAQYQWVQGYTKGGRWQGQWEVVR
jgi:hypothetical protein